MKLQPSAEGYVSLALHIKYRKVIRVYVLDDDNVSQTITYIRKGDEHWTELYDDCPLDEGELISEEKLLIRLFTCFAVVAACDPTAYKFETI